MTRKYNDPAGGSASTIGPQTRTDYYERKALKEKLPMMIFTQMATERKQPKNMGKEIVMFHYLPILHDANINDQGIDAAGATTERAFTVKIIPSNANGEVGEENIYTTFYAVGEGANGAAATTAAKAKALEILNLQGFAGADYATAKAAAEAANWQVLDDASGLADVPTFGNLYGSSRDVGYVQNKMPVLGEEGGTVNRVGSIRQELRSTLNMYGFWTDYTRESVDFDSDKDYLMHVNREMMNAGITIEEDLTQLDLLGAAGVVRYGGIATTVAELTGEGADPSEPTYGGFQRLKVTLDQNRAPKDTKVLSGVNLTDTKTIRACRYAYVPSDLEITLEAVNDHRGDAAFTSVEKYQKAGQVAEGEIGAIGNFRFVSHHEMMKWEGAGADVTTNPGYFATNGNYDVFPILVVGSGSFNVISFRSSGKGSNKFTIIHKKPSKETATAEYDPFGMKGFMSIQWYHGFLALRPEWIAVYKVVGRT